MRPRRFSFIQIASSLLALLHLYIGWRILPDLPVSLGARYLGGLLLAVSVVLIPAGFRARRTESGPWSDRLAWAGFLAMGWFSSLLVLTLLRDVGLVVARLFGVHSAALLSWSATAVPASAFLMTLIGLINARRVARVVEVNVPIANLPAALHGFRIAQISDLHVGPTIKRNYVEAVVARTNSLQADVIALTGDLVDGSVSELALHTAPLGRLSSRFGSYAVTGNHEYYSGAQSWIEEWRRLGIVPLLNRHAALTYEGATVVLAGVTDYTAHQFDASHASDPQAALAGAPLHAAVKILLAHQPRTANAAAAAGFDLQLSGHTHGGQFFPWNFFVPLQQPFVAGLRRLDRLWVYTSRGTGYWGPPKRFGAPSEITLVKLVTAIQ